MTSAFYTINLFYITLSKTFFSHELTTAESAHRHQSPVAGPVYSHTHLKLQSPWQCIIP